MADQISSPSRDVSRRQLLALGALTALGWTAGPRTALGAVSMRGLRQDPPDHVLVTIFLRGGADGLSLVAPYADDNYYRLRPTIALASPNDSKSNAADRLIDIGGFYGLHPALARLAPLYERGEMAVIHACGSGDQTLSHFEAMATMERGLYRDDGPASGWLARHLETAPWRNDTPLRAVALGTLVPDSLRGATSVTALTGVDQLKLATTLPGGSYELRQKLARLYGADPHFQSINKGNENVYAYTNTSAVPPDLLQSAGAEALAVLRELDNISPQTYAPAGGAVYPKDDLGQGLRQTALLMKSRLGMEAACLDHYGFDTHVTQGSAHGGLADQLKSLSSAIAAFVADLGPDRWRRTTVVVMSEFGRRIEENSGAGTDHGHGGVMLVLGGHGIRGGRVHGKWPGLMDIDGPGDLRVTTDYRNVLAEILANRLGNPSISQVFPGLQYQAPGVSYA